MAEKNIEMNIKNQENNYDILFPRTIPKQVDNLLNDDTKIYIGLQQDSTPDDAFRQLYLLNVLQGKSALKIILQNQDGIKLKNVKITSDQFCDAKGNKTQYSITDENGEINVFTDAESTVVNISGYFEIDDNTTKTIPTPLGEQLEDIWQITTKEELTLTNSINKSFSGNTKTFDACLVGGGGSGGTGTQNYRYASGGAGGGGGYVQNFYGLEANSDQYIIAIGAGGARNSSTPQEGSNGKDGGTTSITNKEKTVCSVNGGKGGQKGNYQTYTAIGGDGNGKGGNATRDSESSASNGSPGENAQVVYIFDEESRGIAGGGGGGGAKQAQSRYAGINDPPEGGKGGSPGGGAGGYEYPSHSSSNRVGANGQNGIKYGGGGGGGTSCNSDGIRGGIGGKGANGVIFLRWKIE